MTTSTETHPAANSDNVDQQRASTPLASTQVDDTPAAAEDGNEPEISTRPTAAGGAEAESEMLQPAEPISAPVQQPEGLAADEAGEAAPSRQNERAGAAGLVHQSVSADSLPGHTSGVQSEAENTSVNVETSQAKGEAAGDQEPQAPESSSSAAATEQDLSPAGSETHVSDAKADSVAAINPEERPSDPATDAQPSADSTSTSPEERGTESADV